MRHLSLQKQIVLIFSIIAIVVIAILMPLIERNLTNAIDEEMYDILDSAQTNYIRYNFFQQEEASEKQIYHMIYNKETNTLYPVSVLTTKQAKSMISSFLGAEIQQMIDYDKEFIAKKGDFEGNQVYYQIQLNQDQNYIISVVYSEYSSSLILSLKQQVIYILYLALLVIAIVLFIWVSTLIRPLKLIKNYIDNIKNGKEATLTIHRNDEIKEVGDALVSMKQQLDKQEKIKEEMIHNISHDLKTPIAIIQTYGESIKDDIYPYGDKESSCDVIIDNAKRLEKKVKSLLYLNRLDFLSDKSNDQVYTNMKELIETTSLQLQAIHPDIDIILELEDVNFIGSEEHWRVVVENILDNAYRYVKQVIKIILKDQYLEIYNDGEPIDKEYKEQMFEPYQKGTKGQFGLGLSIVKKTVSLYGYKITANNLETGVNFVIEKQKENK